MKYSVWYSVIAYFICGWSSTVAGCLYYFPSEFPDGLFGALFFMPFINFIMMLTYIIGFFANLNDINLAAFVGFVGAISLWLGLLLYVLKKQYIYLSFVIFGTLIINIQTQNFFWLMMSV